MCEPVANRLFPCASDSALYILEGTVPDSIVYKLLLKPSWQLFDLLLLHPLTETSQLTTFIE